MKLTVINIIGGLGLGVLPELALAVHHDLVVDAKFALWHPGQVGLHQDLTGDVCGQHLEKSLEVYFFFFKMSIYSPDPRAT